MLIKNRIQKIFNNSEKELDAIIIKNSNESNIDLNFFYVTNLLKGLYEESITILFPSGELELIITSLESELAKQSNIKQRIYKTKNELIIEIQDLLKSCNNIGINSKSITLNDYTFLINILKDKEIKDISNALIKSRMIKDDFEISQIKKACEITDKVTYKIPELIHNNITEDELAAEINYLIYENGADKEAFDTISSIGKNSAMPHYTHSNNLIKQNDFILCDFGARKNRYNSDLTRTFIYGNASNKQKEIYDYVVNAQKIGLDNIIPGIKANQIHQIVYQYIQNTPYAGKFIHSTGHSLGLAVHDQGLAFNDQCDIILEENMVLTVEPGIYIPGFGGVRIEDDIRVTKNGYELLTKARKELIEIR